MTSIIIDGGRTNTNTFDDRRIETMREWLQLGHESGNKNIYFQVNAGAPDVRITKKAGKANIKSCEWLRVDVDPKGGPQLFEQERQQILTKLKKNNPPPSLIIDSGGGFQGFWKLSELRELKGEPDWTDIERYNRQIRRTSPQTTATTSTGSCASPAP